MSKNEEKSKTSALTLNSETQPYRMRLPGFIFDEDIGLGDVIKRATYAAGIRPASGCGCDRRAAMLNNWIVFSPRHP
jgi:hypothetical protein